MAPRSSSASTPPSLARDRVLSEKAALEFEIEKRKFPGTLLMERFMAVRWSGLEDSELIAGEALATALAKLDNYRSEQGSLMSWVIGIAQRKALTAYRRQTADKIEEETKYEKEHRERFHFKARPDEALTHALLEAILAMPEADHYLLHLTMVDRLSIAAAGKILKITPALARKKKQRFLAALEQIKNNPPPPA